MRRCEVLQQRRETERVERERERELRECRHAEDEATCVVRQCTRVSPRDDDEVQFSGQEAALAGSLGSRQQRRVVVVDSISLHRSSKRPPGCTTLSSD